MGSSNENSENFNKYKFGNINEEENLQISYTSEIEEFLT